VRPRIAIASCGPLTQVGHIHPDTIARLEHTGARLYRTDRDGNVTVRTDGQSVTVETQHTPGLSGAQARR
jgi:competence protein ComEC